MFKKRFLRVVAILFLVALLISGCMPEEKASGAYTPVAESTTEKPITAAPTTQGVTYLDDDQQLVMIMDTQQQFYNVAQSIIIGDVIKTEVKKYKYFRADNEQPSDYYVITIKVSEDLKGGFHPGDEVKICDKGNGQTILSKLAIKSGGYFQEGDKVIVLLGGYSEESNEDFKKLNNGGEMPYGQTHYQGKYWINSNGELENRCVEELQKYDLFKDCKTVDDFKLQIAKIAQEQESDEKN